MIIQLCGVIIVAQCIKFVKRNWHIPFLFFRKCGTIQQTEKEGKSMSVCFIVGAGDCKEQICPAPGDFLIAADGGADHLRRMGLLPHLMLGDLDSLRGAPPPCPLLQYPAEKDDTDLALAVEAGVARGYTTFLVFGALGGSRLDHTLGAVGLLPGYAARGLSVTLVGGGQRVFALAAGQEKRFSPKRRGYLSLFAAAGDAHGVSAENVKYTLADATLQAYTTLGVSNEFLPGAAARVAVRQGTLLLVWQEEWEEDEK